MSDQLNTFATSSYAAGDLMKRWQQMATDKKFLWPRLEGMNQNTRGYIRQIQPRTIPGFGQTVVYSLQKAGDFCKDLELELQLSAITQVGGTFVAYKNDIGGLFFNIRLYQGGALIQQRDFNENVFNDLFTRTFEETQALSESNGILPFATRAARAAAGPQTFFIPIRTLLDYFSCPLSLLSDEIQIQISFQPLLSMIQFDGTNPTASVLSANIRGEFFDVNPALMNEMLSASKIGSLPFPIVDLATVQEVIPAGTITHRMQLSQFRGMVSWFGGWVREQQQAFDMSGNPLFEYTNSVAYQDFNVQDRGINVISNPDNIVPGYTQLHTIPLDFHNYFNPAFRFTDFPMMWSWSLEPTLDLHLQEPIQTGCYNFDQTQSGYLVVNFAAPLVNPCVITAYGYFFNALLLTNGSLRKFLV